MKKNACVLFFFLLLISRTSCYCKTLYSQSAIDTTFKLKKNALYFELFGNGLFYSFNYERMFYQKNNLHFDGRMGFSVIPFADWGDEGEEAILAMFPVEVNMLIGKRKNFLETGICHTYNTQVYRVYHDIASTNEIEFTNYHRHSLSLRIGYRFQKPGGKFLFRIAALPQLIYRPGFVVVPGGHFKKFEPAIWGGITFGCAF